MAEKDLQLNEGAKGYFRLPYSAFRTPLYGNGGRAMRRAELALYGLISSLATKDNACRMSYRKFEEKLRLSHGTVARGIGVLKSAGKITQDKSHRSGAEYTGEKWKGAYIKFDLYLYATKFEFRGGAPRYLTDAEITVLCHLRSHCSNKRGNGVFVGSVRGIAHTLNLSKTTVQKALDALIGAELVYRKKEDRGLNGHKRSGYTVNAKLLRRTEKAFKKESSPKTSSSKRLTEQERAADARADRERYYADLRQLAYDRAESFMRRANADGTYFRLNGEIQALEPKIARAEVFSLPELEALTAKKRALTAARAKRLAELGISETDLKPRYRCPKCSDTGFRPNGRMCGCYPEGGKR